VIIDTSALVAILLDEPERRAFLGAIASSASPRMSAASLLETAAVVDRRNDPTLSRALDALLDRLVVEIVPVDEEQARVGRAAYRDFGRGSGHPAGLNFGDCFAYALASATGAPLLFKGDDFGHTDVIAAV
jgi:ribonuclease VapC